MDKEKIPAHICNEFHLAFVIAIMKCPPKEALPLSEPCVLQKQVFIAYGSSCEGGMLTGWSMLLPPGTSLLPITTQKYDHAEV